MAFGCAKTTAFRRSSTSQSRSKCASPRRHTIVIEAHCIPVSIELAFSSFGFADCRFDIIGRQSGKEVRSDAAWRGQAEAP